MAKKPLVVLTETMFYVLMALLNNELCGIEIMEFISSKTCGRVRLGPGTLYAILAKFEELKIIHETSVEGRKRNYILTEKGRNIFNEELNRLKSCISDGESEVL